MPTHIFCISSLYYYDLANHSQNTMISAVFKLIDITTNPTWAASDGVMQTWFTWHFWQPISSTIGQLSLDHVIYPIHYKRNSMFQLTSIWDFCLDFLAY